MFTEGAYFGEVNEKLYFFLFSQKLEVFQNKGKRESSAFVKTPFAEI